MGQLLLFCDLVRDMLQHASPHGGQDGCTDGGSEGHLGGRGTTERNGVALVCPAAIKHRRVCDTDNGGVGGNVARSALSAAQCVEADGGGD